MIGSRKGWKSAVQASVLALSLGLASCSGGSGVAQKADWIAYGNNSDEQHYSDLEQINAGNVDGIKLDWELEIPDAAAFVAPPLAIDGILYFTGDRSIVRAVDGSTGKLLWTYDPEVYKPAPRRTALGWNTNRGLAYANGKLFLGAADGRLIAIDMKTGKESWAVSSFAPGDEANKAITGAPRAFGNVVVIGFGGGEYLARGYVSAFDTETGKLLWRFYTVPGDPAKKDGAASDDVMPMLEKTWAGEYWKVGGGGTVWNAMTYDKELDQLYIGVSNGGPWNYKVRSQGQGDNLFLGSIVALNPRTGKYIWHYQATPGERWDYKSTGDMILADAKIGGQDRKILMQAHSNGFFYVIDRKSGKLLSAEPFSKVNWASKVDLATGRPVENSVADYDKNPGGLQYPGTYGAHNWQPMAYSPKTRLVYIPETQQPTRYFNEAGVSNRENFIRLGVRTEFPQVDARDGKGSLVAWDPVTQKAKWTVPYDSFWNGGILSTGGNLVFQGTGEGKFAAFNAETGDRLWEIDVQRGITAPPITYSIKGTQHVAILVGFGGLSSFGLPFLNPKGYKYKDGGIRLLSFSLKGKKELAQLTTRTGEFAPIDTGTAPINVALATRGGEVYHGAGCAVCHGGQVKGGSTAPDLRESGAAADYETVRKILKDGLLLANGMPQFSDLSDDEVKAIVEYIKQETRAAKPLAKGK